MFGSATVALARARLAQADTANARELLHGVDGSLSAGYGPEHWETREARALLDSLGVTLLADEP